MSAIPSWQLFLALIALLAACRVLAWWVWRGLSLGGARLAHGLPHWLPRLAGPHSFRSRLTDRWPRLSTFLRKRFATDRFVGLPLTLMAVLGTYLVFLFAGLVEEVLEGDEIAGIDRRINQAAGLLRDQAFVDFFGFVTSFGAVATLAAASLVTIGFLWAHGRSHYIPGLLLTITGSEAITWIGKFTIMRARPEFLTAASAASPSFPSAHATGALAVYGFIVYAISRDLTGLRARFELVYWGTVLVLLIAASRIMLSVHFASDVLAGLLVGAFWLLSGFALTEYLRGRQPAGDRRQ